MNRPICLLLLALASFGADAQRAGKPPTVALIAAIGDQVDVVRQRERTGSHAEPFSRKSLAINGRLLNMAVLKGLNQAIEEEEPLAQRVLLNWTAPADTQAQLAQAHGKEREAIILSALQAHLRAMPSRADWDRIEAILPSYFYAGFGGMGSKLSGVGFYVQPLDKGAAAVPWEADAPDGATADMVAETGSGYRTVNPRTGEVGSSNTYIAAYMYFERVTLDACSLDVIARKRQLDNVKYADPEATALDVGDQVPFKVMAGKLLTLAERSAYVSVRGASQVFVTAPKPLSSGASAPR